MYFAGIDIGSTMTKIVIMDDEINSQVIGPTGAEHRHLANKVMEEALSKAGIAFDELTYVVATGYGRINVPFADKQITEITCHAKGVSSIFPSARTVIDIGGQDAKGIKISGGKVVNFVMNDKCAAGTGRFLEVIADALGLKLNEMGELSLQSKEKVRISNTCTIFAEQEVVSKIADGVPIEDILAGLHEAIASRVFHMAEKMKIEKDVAMTGGVAKNVGMVKALEDQLGFPVLIAREPLLTGAIGAAILGKELVIKALEKGEAIEKGARLLEAASFFK
ncbi:MAG: 2-hydroxyglutaryl-CoA dehydratase [Proteobacteria bacterium]|nr:2-hydroxyglutaryl-CoA dehydratase [Pseudomonadota bacterium]MBU4073764.1 2-hydroxyglutaryl-CoA dehydratase [Pseudomonadota bacterium]